jgi:glycopeptide antibiotics resistance protein
MNNARQFPDGRTFLALSVQCALLLIYGCLVPFEMQELSFAEAIEQFRTVISKPIAVVHRMDWAVNILLFVPLGFCVAGAFALDRGHAARLGVLPCAIPIGLFSAGIEFAQLWFPKRVSSVQDVVANSAGGLIGILVWLAVGEVCVRWVRNLSRVQNTETIYRKLLPGYLIALILLHLAPFDFTSPSDLWHKWKEGRVRLVPFTFPEGHEVVQLEKLFFNIGYFLPMGLLLAGMRVPRGRDNHAAAKVYLLGLGLATIVESLQLLVYSRDFNTTDILSGSLAVSIGWSMSRLMRGDSDADEERSFRLILLVGWCAGLMLMSWLPANFNLNLEAAQDRWEHVNKIPFQDYFEKDYIASFDKMFQKLLLFVPIGVLLSSRKFASLGWVILFAVLFAALLEAGQLFLPSRFASVSDVLIEPLGAALGFLATRWLIRNGTGGMPPC